MKKIAITLTDVTSIVDRIKSELLTAKGVPEKIDYTINPSITLKDEEKVEVVFENEAYKKMYALIDESKEEIGWYGIVERESDRHFIIKDIILFPQLVTGATVKTDDAEFRNWQDSLDDETFNKLRFYGHSHVHMATTPSGVDTAHFNNMLQNLRDFYIFAILNKSKSSWFNIYDVANNTLYESKDIKFKYFVTEEDTWAKEEIKKFVKVHTYTPQNYARPANNPPYSGGYGAYGSGYGQTGYGANGAKGSYDRAQDLSKKNEPNTKGNTKGSINEDEGYDTPGSWYGRGWEDNWCEY